MHPPEVHAEAQAERELLVEAERRQSHYHSGGGGPAAEVAPT